MKSDKNLSFSEEITILFTEIKEYLDIKYDIARLDITEKMVIIFTQFYTFFIFILIVPSVFLFLSFALAYYLGIIFGAIHLGFLVVGIIYIFITILFVIFRKVLISKPLVKILSSMILKSEK
ncbi:MAG: hypothetical protein JXR51_04290 [Bacteroidales bacterium]|nr:hypothetical protein [Bacteroidales bacterium]MBN2756375.1 hypothetical protein [Bacteroidales bacterium]